MRILLYHRVLDIQKGGDFCSLPGIIVSVNMFNQQMRYLSKNYNVISLDHLVDSLKNNSPLPKKGVVITFDDGWRDNYSFALPILKKYNLPATIFLTSGYIGTNKTFWPEQVMSILRSEGNLKEKLKNLSDEIYPSVIQECLNDLVQYKKPYLDVLTDLIEHLKYLRPLKREVVTDDLRKRMGSAGELIQKQERSLHTPHPDPAKGGELHKSPPPLIGSTIRQAHGAERSRSTSSLQVGGGEGEGDHDNLFNSFAIVSGNPSMLSWEEIEFLEKNNINFGSHSINHPILTQLDKTEAKKEIFDSKKEIEKKLNKQVLAFAYPNGDFNDEVKDLVKQAGYQCAVTLGSGLNDKHADVFSLSRRNVHDSISAGPRGRFSKALFACQIDGIPDVL